jgi:hypothetical protein
MRVRFLENVGALDLSSAQRAYVRAGREPLQGDEEREAYATMTGLDPDAPVDPAASRFRLLVKGRRCGGTKVSALAMLFDGLTFDFSNRRPAERVHMAVLGSDIRQAREAMADLSATVARTPELAAAVVAQSTEKLEIKRPTDGRILVLECLPATISASRGRWYSGALFTEIAMAGSADGAHPTSEVVAGIMAALLPGAVMYGETTPWTVDDYVGKLFASDLPQGRTIDF